MSLAETLVAVSSPMTTYGYAVSCGATLSNTLLLPIFVSNEESFDNVVNIVVCRSNEWNPIILPKHIFHNFLWK